MSRKVINPRNVRANYDAIDAREKAFVREYVRTGGNGVAAALKAGYAEPKVAAIELTRRASLSLAIRAEQIRYVSGELGSCALRTIAQVMRDESFRASDRLAAARLAMEAARMIGRAAADAPRERPIAEMSTAELDAMLAQTQAALSQLTAERRTIEHKPAADTSSDAQSTDVPVPQIEVERAS